MLWSMRPNWIQRYNSKIHDICHLTLDPLPPPLDVKFLLLFTPLSLDPSPIIVYTWPNLINWLVEAWMIFGVDVDSKSSCMILDFVIQEEVEWLEESLCDMRRCVACKERFCDLSGYVTLVQVVWYEGSNMAISFQKLPPLLPLFDHMATFIHCLFFETQLDIRYKDAFSLHASFVSCFFGASRLVSAKVKKKG